MFFRVGLAGAVRATVFSVRANWPFVWIGETFTLVLLHVIGDDDLDFESFERSSGSSVREEVVGNFERDTALGIPDADEVGAGLEEIRSLRVFSARKFSVNQRGRKTLLVVAIVVAT